MDHTYVVYLNVILIYLEREEDYDVDNVVVISLVLS